MTNQDSNITATQFLNELNAHDWHYGYSDDHKAYTAGSENSQRLAAIAETSKELNSLYRAYCLFVNGEAEKPSVEVSETTTEATGFTLNNLKKLVSDGKIFHIEFIKRTTGELRKMRCRLGVTKHLKGGDKKYSPKAKQLLTVFDMESKGYRSIPVEGICSLTVGGQLFSII